MINRINKYLSEVEPPNKELYEFAGAKPPEAPPIIKHKDNISQLTIFNTGWSEGYYAGYEDGQAFNTVNRVTVGVFLLVVLITGIAIGIAL